jgi:hypothetical protein
MEIALYGELSEQDIKHALILGHNQSFRVSRIVVPLFLALLVLWSLALAIWSLVSEHPPLDPMILVGNFLPAILLLLFLGFFVYLARILPARQARRLLSCPLLKGTFQGMATDESLALNNDVVTSTVRWDGFVQFKMSDDAVLLYQNSSAASIVPCSLFASDGDWEYFRQHVQATVPREQARSSPARRWMRYAMYVLIFIGALLLTLFGTR